MMMCTPRPFWTQGKAPNRSRRSRALCTPPAFLDRLHSDILKHYAGDDKTRIERITVEVNRNVKELSGKTAQEQAKEQGQQTAQFRSVEKKLTAADEGNGVRLTPGLVRKGRIAEDLAWACPYTGKPFDALDLLHRRVEECDGGLSRGVDGAGSILQTKRGDT